MKAFFYGIYLQWKLDLRNREVILTYYLIPIVFFLFMGGIFTSINPEAYKNLIQVMAVFGVTMGAFLGAPAPLVELIGSDVKKAYLVGGIPLWSAVVNNFISSFVHLSFMSLFIYFVAPIAYGAEKPSDPGLFFVSLALFIVASLCIGTVLGLSIKKPNVLIMVSQFWFLPSVMLSGIMFPVTMLPKFLQAIGYIFPAFWGNRVMQSGGWRFLNIFPLLIIILVNGGISLWLTSRLKNDKR